MSKSQIDNKSLVSASNGLYDIELTSLKARLGRLPDEARSLSFIQLTDFHRKGDGTDPLIKQAVQQANDLDADYVFLTGDFVDGKVRDILPIVRLLEQLRARRGIFAVLGNHDHYANPAIVENAMESIGIAVLNNRASQIVDGLWVAGVDDLHARKTNLPLALSNVPENAALIVLSHNPEVFKQLSPDRSALMLSGHTHGGQFHIPLLPAKLICWWHLKTTCDEGWFERGQAKLYVNRGIGVTGPPPLDRRIRCKPEIARFMLE